MLRPPAYVPQHIIRQLCNDGPQIPIATVKHNISDNYVPDASLSTPSCMPAFTLVATQRSAAQCGDSPHSHHHSLAAVDLVAHNEDGLIGEQRLDGVEQRRLLRDGVAALLADVYQVGARGAQVRQRRDGLQQCEERARAGGGVCVCACATQCACNPSCMCKDACCCLPSSPC